MTEDKPYKCVNCGQPAAALFKTYGPSVLKLTKCDKCKGIVDKYTEYDPVIVMIDLVLMSKEAQRHVLYNTEFKSYWKLLIVLIMLETYGVWRSDSLFNIVVDTVCGNKNNNTINSTLLVPLEAAAARWRGAGGGGACAAWGRDEKGDDADLFIWEKDFYIKFISIFAGIAAFILTVQSSMELLKPLASRTEGRSNYSCIDNCLSQERLLRYDRLFPVRPARLLKAFSLGNASILFTLPMLVWGHSESAGTRALHYWLVFLYSGAVFAGVLSVLYECPLAVTILVLTVSNIAKYTTSFYVTPYVKNFVT